MKRKPFARQLQRVRKICLACDGALEKLSHGMPTFFIKRGVFAMFANNHHGDGRVAVWVPAPPGLQGFMIEADPRAYFRPPYMGPRGWLGVDLDQVDTPALEGHIRQAWTFVAAKRRTR